MKTRRFRALNGAKGEYSRVVEKIAIYDDNGNQVDCCVIHSDPKEYEGKEYYYPSNPNDKFGLYTDKPMDAIESIRNGIGDGLQQSKLFGFTMMHVLRFLDREYGENIRQKTVEGWKDSKFAYAVKMSYLNSFEGGREVLKNMKLYDIGDFKEDILTFDNIEDASNFIKEIEIKTQEYCEQYENLPLTGDDVYDYKNVITPFFDSIFFDSIEKEMKSGVDSVYWNVFSSMEEGREKNKKMYKLKVIQVVLP